MPAAFLYLIKLSMALAAVYLFYQLVLRRLTFYNWNRLYLLGYTAIAFFIPFINISTVLEKTNWVESGIIRWVPSIGSPQTIQGFSGNNNSYHFSAWDLCSLILASGIFLLLIRLIIKLISFSRMKKRAIPVVTNELNIYQLDENIIPFSFGNSIFINRNLHTEHELHEIIRHEIIHVKQKHSIDIVWSELLCIINWYNPFAWLIRNAVRQNLEFIADNKVVETGISKKEYQYLLLKVIGNNQYSIAAQFNFSSLKKRIAMMNKTKSAKRQLLRMLFLLPATAILLLAFRSNWNKPRVSSSNYDKKVTLAGMIVDASTLKPLAGVNIYCKESNLSTQTDERGYYKFSLPFENKPLQFSMQLSKNGYEGMNQYENWGNFYHDQVYTRYGKTIELFAMAKPENAAKAFSTIAGNATDETGLAYENVVKHLELLKKRMTENEQWFDTIPPRKAPNSKGYVIEASGAGSDCILVVKDKKGKEIERIPLSEWAKDAKKYTALYGEVSLRTFQTMAQQLKTANLAVRSINIKDNLAEVTLDNESKETYDLSIASEKKKYEEKYGWIESRNEGIGEIIEVPVTSTVALAAASSSSLTTTVPLTLRAEIAPTEIRTTVPVTLATSLKPLEVKTTVPVALTTNLKLEEVKVSVAATPLKLAERSITNVHLAEAASLVEIPAILNLGGLTMQNKGQYILVDGKEPDPQYNGELKGTYRITFLDEKDAIKKYGDKGKYGAVILETLKADK